MGVRGIRQQEAVRFDEQPRGLFKLTSPSDRVRVTFLLKTEKIEMEIIPSGNLPLSSQLRWCKFGEEHEGGCRWPEVTALN